MFVKADFVLLWLGDDRFAEVKPLKTVTTTLSPLVEWQLLTDSIHVIHEKRATERKARKPRQPKTKPQPPPKNQSVSTPRKGQKRHSKIDIDYKSMHKEGLTTKSPRQQKTLPRASGPSESRIESQRMITRELLQKQTKAKGFNTTAKIIGTCVKTEDKEDKKSVKREIKQEFENKQQPQKRIKIEASEIHMVHRTNPEDTTKIWNYVHPSGSSCGRKHQLRGNLRADELLDLIMPVPISNTPNITLQPPVSTPHATNNATSDSEHLPGRLLHQHTSATVSTPQAVSNIADTASTQASPTYGTSNVQLGSIGDKLTNTPNERIEEYELKVPTPTRDPMTETHI